MYSKNRIWTSKRQIHKNKEGFIFVICKFGEIPNPLCQHVRGEQEETDMPRKREAEYEKNRTKNRRITFRVSQEEYEMIRERATKCGLSVNSYLLRMAGDGVIIVQNYENLSLLANAINKIGVNINQLAHYANEYGYVEKGDWKIIKEKMCEIHILMLNTIRTNTGKGVERKKKAVREIIGRKETESNGVY